MKLGIGTASVAMIALIGCTEQTSQSSSITSEEAFVASVVGRTLTFEGSTFTINADGTVSGPWDGSGITGTWYWEDQYWCREIAIGDQPRPLDCQAWTVNGNIGTVTRDRGNGATFDYIIS